MMKNFKQVLITTILTVTMASNINAAVQPTPKPTEKRVCYVITVKNKQVQKCKQVKIHKKFAGKQLPKK